jgi:hypothetical protein
MTNIRFDGIDTLETHFQEMRQNLAFAHQARDFMLAQLGFTGIEFWLDQPNQIRAVDNNPRRGFLIANEVESNGRTVAFVHIGESSEADGAEIFRDAATMEQSVNVALLNASHTGLFIQRSRRILLTACAT